MSVEKRNPGRQRALNEQRSAQALEDYFCGKSIRRIADEMNVSRMAVYRVIARDSDVLRDNR